jgi:hypothetical protein
MDKNVLVSQYPSVTSVRKTLRKISVFPGMYIVLRARHMNLEQGMKHPQKFNTVKHPQLSL